jgi:hypothetical protein
MPTSLNNTYMVNKDGQLLTEAYLSALQKYHNIPHTIKPRQPDDTHEAETYEDRMQGITNNTTNDKTEQPTFDDVVAVVIKPETSSTTDTYKTEAIEMAKTNLYTIYKASKQLHDFINSGHELDYWMNEKLAVCSEQLSNILKVAEYDFLSKNYSNNTESISINPSL